MTKLLHSGDIDIANKQNDNMEKMEIVDEIGGQCRVLVFLFYVCRVLL